MVTTLVDLCDHVKLKLSGPDRTRYLQGQITNDLALLDGGATHCLQACVCDAKGKLQAHVFVRKLTETKTTFDTGQNPVHAKEVSYLIDAPPALREDDLLLNRLARYIIADDCEIEDVSDAFQLYHLIGDERGNSSGDDELAQPVPRFGPPGTDILLSALHDSVAFPDSMVPRKPEDLHPGLERLRITHGIPAWGAELLPGMLPPEAGPAFIDANISYTKGCYIGQEIISRVKSVGRVNRQLCAFITVGGHDDPQPGWTLSADDKPVGVLTSTAFCPEKETTIALGYVKRDFAAPGASLTAFAEPSDGAKENSICATLEIREIPLR